MNDEAIQEQHKDVYAHAELALYWAQCFEQGLETVLLIQSRLSGRCVTLSDLDSYETEVASKTLGRLLREVRQHVAFPADAEQLIATALKNRNFLAHRFFKERAKDWYRLQSRLALVEELQTIQESFSAADAVIIPICRVLRLQIGVTDEWVEAAVKRIETQEQDA